MESMESKVEFVRERPAGMIPFVLGLAVAGGAAFMIGSSEAVGFALGVLAVGVLMIAVGVALFRRPHRVELCGDGTLRVAGRFGAPRTWRSAGLKTPPSEAQVALEAAVFAASLVALTWATDRGLAPGALIGAAYVRAWWQWRMAPRLVVTDEAGRQKTVRLDGIPGVVEALAAREPRPVALAG